MQSNRKSVSKRKTARVMSAVCDFMEARRLLAAVPPGPRDYLAVADVGQNFGHTQRSIAIYDVTDIRTPGNTSFDPTDSAQASPLFVVWVGYEATDGPGLGTDTNLNYEEISALGISPDGKTGYMLSFDSLPTGATPGNQDTVTGDGYGDYDLYRFDLEEIIADFYTNDRPRGIMYAPRYSPDWNPTGAINSGIDYVTEYAALPLGPTGLPAVRSNDNRGMHRSNNGTVQYTRDNTDGVGYNDIVFIDGIISKVGEVARRGATVSTPNFDQQDIQVVDADTIVLMENMIVTTGTGPITSDYSIRTIERVSTSPGVAAAGPDESGGYNNLTSESWQSYNWTGDNYVNMDFHDGTATGNLSDVDGMRYVSRDGTAGVWVTDRDTGSADFSFFAMDFDTRVATKQEFRAGASPFGKSFVLDEDPTVDPNTNDGDLDGFDLDVNGNLVIRESGFTSDTLDVDQEPKFISRGVANYNAGDSDTNTINELTFGAWATSPNIVVSGANDDDAGVTNSLFGTLSAAQNLVYLFDTDSGGEPGVIADVYVLDPSTGAVVAAFLNAANQFFTDGNRIRAFRTASADAVAPTVAQAYAYLTEQSVTFTFSEALATGAGALDAADITLTNTTTNTVIPTADLTLVDLGGNVYKLTYKAGASTNPLPKGVYTLTLNTSGITDVAGNALAAPATLTFKVNPGDTDQDGDVDFDDLLVLAQNYGTSGKNYAGGNVNYDGAGAVGFDDLLLLAQNYGTSLAVAPRPTGGLAKRKTMTSDVLA